MKEIVFWGFLIFISVNIVLACESSVNKNANKKQDIILCGKIKEIVIKQKKEEMDHVYAVIDFTLWNNSTSKIIIIPEKLKVISGKSMGKNGNVLTTYGNYGSSFLDSYKEIKQFYENIEMKLKNDKIKIIESNGNFQFTGNLSLELDRLITNPESSWRSIKKNSPFDLILTIQTLDSYFSNDNEAIKASKFWSKLQKRWSKFGYLWLDDVVSEPIPFDVNSVVIKTVEN
jgi:hypothetical protein